MNIRNDIFAYVVMTCHAKYLARAQIWVLHIARLDECSDIRELAIDIYAQYQGMQDSYCSEATFRFSLGST